MERIFTVKINVPFNATVNETEKYIRDALKCHGGSLDPSHPYYNAKEKIVSVNHATANRLFELYRFVCRREF